MAEPWNKNRMFAGRILIISAFALLLVCAASPWTAAAGGDGERLRIGLAYGGDAPSSCEIASANGFVFGVIDANGFRETMPPLAYTRLTLSSSGGYIRVHADGVLVSDDIGVGTCVMPSGYADGAPILYEGVPYRGGLSFRSNVNNTFNVINRLTVAEYLYGTVNSEMSYGNPPEALKAQAVAARSYAARKRGAHEEDGFDMCRTAHCQVYKGYSDEHAETTAAVDGTAGLMLYYDGSPISGNYFKNSGGHTQNSEDVWNAKEAYLRGVPDEYSPPYTWGWQVSFRGLRDLLTAAGSDPGDISSVSVGARSATGSVLALQVVGSRGTVVLEKNDIRAVLGASNVKSLHFTFDGAPPTSPPAPEVLVLSDEGVRTLTGGISVLSAAGLGAPDPADLVIQGATGRAHMSDPPGAPDGVSPQSETATGGNVAFSGSGYGHGVGMPQDSAIEMAKQGFDFRQILTKYFTGVQIW
jgi:stage II sporulation protein D